MPPTLNLSDNQIDLWFIDDVNSYCEEELASYLQLLNHNELVRHQRFVFAKDKRHFLLSRALLRTTLSLYCPAIHPAHWGFEFNSHGKPVIANCIDQSLQFNLSHTQGLIALAVRRNVPVGVDVEGWQRTSNLDALAEQCFTAAEQAYFSRVPDPDRQQRFFHIWTLKEAVVKALGEGLSMGLTSFEFSVANNNIAIHGLDNNYPQSWLLKLWHYGSDHITALATPCDCTNLSIRTFRSRPHQCFSEVDLPQRR